MDNLFWDMILSPSFDPQKILSTIPIRQGIWGITHSTLTHYSSHQNCSHNLGDPWKFYQRIRPVRRHHRHPAHHPGLMDMFIWTPKKNIEANIWHHQSNLVDGWAQLLWKIWVRQVGKLFSTEWKVIIHSCSKAPTSNGHVQKHRKLL